MSTALKTFLQYLVVYGFKNNLVACNGSGALIFQREKMYTRYRILSTIYLTIGILIGGIVSYVIARLSLSSETFDFSKISATIIIIVVGSYNMLVSIFFKRSKKFQNYVYENSFSYAYDTVFTLSVVFTLETALPITLFVMTLLSAVVSVFVTTLIIGFFVKNLNRDYVNEHFRNTTVRLFMFAIFALIFYYLAQMNIVVA